MYGIQHLLCVLICMIQLYAVVRTNKVGKAGFSFNTKNSFSYKSFFLSIIHSWRTNIDGQCDIGSPSYDCSVHYQSKWLHTCLKNWKFANPGLLLEFPIDSENQNFIREVKNALFSYVYPTPLKNTYEVASSHDHVLIKILDLHPSIVNTNTFKLIVSGNGIFKGSKPLAHRYGGHQFGYWADQLGDGRAHLLGEYVNDNGERWELQLKGSGKTPYSRRGDGRAVIRSSVREFLCSEAMFFLGIPTSRAATLVVSDDKVWRDQFYDGYPIEEKTAIVLRLAKSWFRFGSFEILSVNQEFTLLRQLTDFAIRNYFPDIDMEDKNKYLIFYSRVVEDTAELIAKWQSVGFAHGVCNTDNFSILSITIDYGPFGFMDEYNPKMVPNTSDDESRYSFENQPDVGRFNLAKLQIALSPLLNSHQQQTMKQILLGYNDIFEIKFLTLMKSKLGIVNNFNPEIDKKLVNLLLGIMQNTKADFTMTFRQLGDWEFNDMLNEIIPDKLWSLKKLEKHSSFTKWLKLYLQRLQLSPEKDLDRRKHMHNVNPRYILRNWIAEKVISLTEKNDFSLLSTVQNILQNPFQYQECAEALGLSDQPPNWASYIKVSCSS